MVRLVVADDAPFIREIVRSVCERAGITIVGEAADGQEAIDICVELKPDVVLMDIIMPRKNGVEATQEIIAKLPGTRVIAFSTVDQDTMVMRALEAGCCSYLVKPFKSDELLKAILSSLGQLP